MQQESSNSSMVISLSEQCRPSMAADIFSSNGNSTKSTKSATAAKILSVMMIAHKDLVNRYAFCLHLHQLRKFIEEAETLCQEKTNLQLANVDLNNQVKLLIHQNWHPFSAQFRCTSSLCGSFKKKIESERWNEGFSRKIQSPKRVIEECNKAENDTTARVTLPKSITNGFQKFAVVIRSSSATRFRASSSAAGPPSSDSYSVPYEMSSSSSSSSSSELHSRGSSEGEGQEEEERIESVGGEDGKRRYRPHWRRIPVFQRVHSIDTGSHEDNLLAEVSLFEAHGYYTFARDVRSESGLVDDEHTLIHICCPWLPQYLKTEYYEARSGLEILLDPLTVRWESFIQRISKIIMIREEAVIVIRVFKADVLEHDVKIPKSVCKSYQKFKKVIYFCHTSYEKRDPEDLSPVYYPWPGAELEYYNGLKST